MLNPSLTMSHLYQKNFTYEKTTQRPISVGILMMKKVCYIVFYAFNSGNEISKVEGLDGLYQLKELVLDKNKIKVQIEFGSVLHVTV